MIFQGTFTLYKSTKVHIYGLIKPNQNNHLPQIKTLSRLKSAKGTFNTLGRSQHLHPPPLTASFSFINTNIINKHHSKKLHLTVAILCKIEPTMQSLKIMEKLHSANQARYPSKLHTQKMFGLIFLQKNSSGDNF